MNRRHEQPAPRLCTKLMNGRRVWALCVVVVLSAAVGPACNTRAQAGSLGAAPIFDDGFENAATFLDLFPLDVSRWTNFQLQPAGNTVDVTTERVHSGVQALKCTAQAYDGVTASKAGISIGTLPFANGDEAWTEIWVYVVGGAPTPNLFLWDLEAPGTCTTLASCPLVGTGDICSSPGRRLYLSGPTGDWIKSDLGKWCTGVDFQQTPGQELSLPVDQWVRLRTYQRLSVQANGVMKVWQNDDLIIDAVGITLPREDAIYNRLEVGITANGDEANSRVLYLDDVRVWAHAPAWWLLFNNEVPTLSVWSLAVMFLLLLVIGTLAVPRHTGVGKT